MKLNNEVNVEYTKMLPDGTITILQKQSNIVQTILMPRKKPVYRIINTYNLPLEPKRNLNNFNVWHLLLILALFRFYTDNN